MINDIERCNLYSGGPLSPSAGHHGSMPLFLETSGALLPSGRQQTQGDAHEAHRFPNLAAKWDILNFCVPCAPRGAALAMTLHANCWRKPRRTRFFTVTLKLASARSHKLLCLITPRLTSCKNETCYITTMLHWVTRALYTTGGDYLKTEIHNTARIYQASSNLSIQLQLLLDMIHLCESM